MRRNGRYPLPQDTSMRIVQVVSSLDADAGGPSRTVTGLAAALARRGCSPSILNLHPRESDAATVAVPPTVPVHRLSDTHARGPGAANLLSAYRRMRAAFPTHPGTIVHVNGIWLPLLHAAMAEANRRALPLVVSPRGMLEPWSLAYRRWKKRIAWLTYAGGTLRGADLLHATSQDEAQHLRALGFTCPIVVIPNGVEIPDQPAAAAPAGMPRKLLFLSRIHPKKGLPLLIQAWATLRPQGWRLVVAGPDELDHEAQMRALAARLGVAESVDFIGAVSDRDKWAVYRSADLYVLPTFSENFGVTVAEALGVGVPVLTTTGTPWRELQAHGCGWWIDPTVEALVVALRQAIAMDRDALAAMGARGRALVAARYGWDGIAEQMHSAYRWLLTGGARPTSIGLY